MSKNKEIVKILLDDIASLRSKVALLDTKVESLDDNLAFYAGSINNLEMDVKRLSYDFHEEQRIEPYVVNTNQTNWLEKTIKDIDEMALEKKVREAIVAKLEEFSERNSCDCGEYCTAYDNGFQTAISTIRNM